MTDRVAIGATLAKIVADTWCRLDAGVPAEAERAARRLLLDCAACAAAGFTETEVDGLARALAAGTGATRGPLGAPVALPARDAALVAGAAVCRDEACEGLARAHGRPGIHAYAALVGALCRADAPLGAVIEAFVAGYEVGGRAGAILRILPGMHVDGTWGAFAASAALSRLAGLPAEAATERLAALACQLPASLFAPLAHGDTVRNLYTGHAAAFALTVADALAAGFTAPLAALEAVGDFTFRVDPTALPDSAAWLVAEAYLKPFAAVRHAHYPAAAAIALSPQVSDRLDAVEEITVATYTEALTYASNRAPQTSIAAQFSLSWASARALVSGDLGPEATRPDALADPLTRRLEARVRLVADEARFPAGHRGARLEITAGGALLSAEVDGVTGDPGHAWTDAALAQKARRYLAPIGDAEAVERVVSALLSGPADTRAAGLLCPALR